MKIVGILQGLVALRALPEDYLPVVPPPNQAIINLIASKFNFLNINSGGQGEATVFEQGGHILKNGSSVAVHSLIITRDGCIIASANTHAADEVADAFIDLLVEEFNYRYNEKNVIRSYQSAIVVEFDQKFSESFSTFYDLIGIVNKRADRSFYLKRVAFSASDPALEVPGGAIQRSPVETIERCEFSIERRIGVDLSQSRYFCVAPMSTSKHAETLEEIEKSICNTKPRLTKSGR